ncbi:MAG: PD-(D/E)XK nuclease family protein, partial [Clostridia bacterium]|nr:PD-(D/E)XK nuclease family protein [Clostridia bacterium]
SYLEAGGEYFEAVEVKILLGLLNVIDNCEQDIPMLTVMRSIFGGFSTEEMAMIRAHNKGMSYYEAMQAYMLDTDDPLADKIRDFLLKIEAWAERAAYEPLEALLWEIVYDNGFLAFVEALPEGDRRLKNIELLIDKISQLEAVGGLSLYKLIRVLEKIEDFSVDMGGQGGQQQEMACVKIMTIHKSKGLEFPVVFLAGANRKFNLKDVQGSMLLHKDHGIGLKYVDPWRRITTKSVPQVVIKQRILEENLAEEMRVLYVALTRAVDRLIITAYVGNLETSEKKWMIGDTLFNLKRGRSYLDWIMMILKGDHTDKRHFKIDYQLVDEVFLHRRLGDRQTNGVVDLLANHQVAPSFAETMSQLKTMDHYVMRETLPAKISVSSMKRLIKAEAYHYQQALPPLVEKPKFMQDNQQLAPEERGTRIHHILRHIDYRASSTYEGLMTAIDTLEARGIVSKEGLQEEDYRKIGDFLKSSLGERIVRASDVKREAPFVFKKKIDDTEVLVQGIIDLYFNEGDDIVLVDFKTDHISIDQVESRSRQYLQQLDMYAEAIERITGKCVSQRYLYFLEIGIASAI